MKLKVLVVDDFPDATEIICMLVELLGHETRSANTGHRALEVAGEFDPDVVILDIGLPDLSGFEVARALRQSETTKRRYLAAISGWGQVEDRVKAIAAGFDQHNLKPASAEVLRSILDAAERVISVP